MCGCLESNTTVNISDKKLQPSWGPSDASHVSRVGKGQRETLTCITPSSKCLLIRWFFHSPIHYINTNCGPAMTGQWSVGTYMKKEHRPEDF